MIAFRTLLGALLLGCLLPAAATEEEATPVSELDAQEFPLRSKVKANPGSNRATAKTPLVASLSFSLLNELAATQAGNIYFSPASLEELLQLLRAWASGSTLSTLEALPYGNPDGENHRHLHSVSLLAADESLKPAEGEAAATLRFAPLAAAPQAAATQLNSWFAQVTAGNIPTPVPAEAIAADARLLAINTTFMRKKWQLPFYRCDSEAAAPFHKADGTTVPVVMMRQLHKLRYAEGKGWRAVALDYRDRRGSEPTLCFIGILPTGDAREFARKLTMPKYDAIRRALSTAEPRPLHVCLPRMELASTLSLRAALSKLGAAGAFGEGADYSRLLPGTAPADILQHSRLDVVEEEQPKDHISFYSIFCAPCVHRIMQPALRFDRPFVWAVDDLTTGAAPAFMGVYEGN